MVLWRPGAFELAIRYAVQWLRHSARILHRLWLEVSGAIFFGLAFFGVPSALREWRAYQAGAAGWKLAAAIVFMVMMTAFGVYSFLRARRLR